MLSARAHAQRDKSEMVLIGPIPPINLTFSRAIYARMRVAPGRIAKECE